MSASHDVLARRHLRKAVGDAGLTALDEAIRAAALLRAEMQARTNRLQLLIGRETPGDFERPILTRLASLTDSLDLLSHAYLAHLEREREITRSIWTRFRWLLTGGHGPERMP